MGFSVVQFSRPYQIATDGGVKIFLPARYAEEIKNNKHLSFKKAIAEVSMHLGRGGQDTIILMMIMSLSLGLLQHVFGPRATSDTIERTRGHPEGDPAEDHANIGFVNPIKTGTASWANHADYIPQSPDDR